MADQPRAEKRGSPLVGRLRQMESLFDRMSACKDYWQVRALRAEGHDIPERVHPSQEERFHG